MAVLVPKENKLTDLWVQYNEAQLFYELLMNTSLVRLLIQADAAASDKTHFTHSETIVRSADLVWQLSVWVLTHQYNRM